LFSKRENNKKGYIKKKREKKNFENIVCRTARGGSE